MPRQPGAASVGVHMWPACMRECQLVSHVGAEGYRFQSAPAVVQTMWLPSQQQATRHSAHANAVPGLFDAVPGPSQSWCISCRLANLHARMHTDPRTDCSRDASCAAGCHAHCSCTQHPLGPASHVQAEKTCFSKTKAREGGGTPPSQGTARLHRSTAQRTWDSSARPHKLPQAAPNAEQKTLRCKTPHAPPPCHPSQVTTDQAIAQRTHWHSWRTLSFHRRLTSCADRAAGPCSGRAQKKNTECKPACAI